MPATACKSPVPQADSQRPDRWPIAVKYSRCDPAAPATTSVEQAWLSYQFTWRRSERGQNDPISQVSIILHAAPSGNGDLIEISAIWAARVRWPNAPKPLDILVTEVC